MFSNNEATKFMHINRQTYEEFFLLYTDGELSPGEKKAVEDFVRENPDLQTEFNLLTESVFKPDQDIVFEDKEVLYRHESRIISFPWFRIAAAAVVVLSLTVVGWVYLSNSGDNPPPAVASKELVRENKLTKPESLTQVEPSVSTVSEQVQTPAEKINNRPSGKSSIVVTLINEQRRNNDRQENIADATDDEKGFTLNDIPSPSRPDHDVISIEESGKDIDIPVAAREIAQQSAFTQAEVITTVEYVEAEDDNMIYFANTSLPKKSKLRGVFRKATRFLDKVTSIQ
jgi:hypothetical protein